MDFALSQDDIEHRTEVRAFLADKLPDCEPTADTQLARVLSTTCDNAIGRLVLKIYGPESREYASFADSNFHLAMTAGVAVGATEVQPNLIASRFLGLPRD